MKRFIPSKHWLKVAGTGKKMPSRVSVSVAGQIRKAGNWRRKGRKK